MKIAGKTFSVTMWVLYLAILPPEEIHRIIQQLSGNPQQVRRLQTAL